MKLRLHSLKKNVKAFVNLEAILSIGLIFAGLMILAYVIFTIQDSLITPTTSATVNASLANITGGFDDAVNLLIIAVTIMILALMIACLYFIKVGRGKK